MLRAVWSESGLEIVDQEPGPLEPGWVRLQVEACGICGSDLHFWHRELPPPLGTSPGHEFVGTVVDGPAGLPDVRYAVSPNVTCGKCAFCLSGRSNLCGRAGPGIGLGRNGGLAELVDAPLANLAPIPDGVGPVVASLTEPLAVTVRGIGAARLERRQQGAWCSARVRSVCAPHWSLAIAPPKSPSRRAIRTNKKRPSRLGVTVLREDDAIAWGKEHRPDVVVESVGGAAGTMPTRSGSSHGADGS